MCPTPTVMFNVLIIQHYIKHFSFSLIFSDRLESLVGPGSLLGLAT